MTGGVPRWESALAGIRRIRGVSWRWREDAPLAELAGRGGEAQAGVIAQEVQSVFPELVVAGESGYLMVDYGGLAPGLVPGGGGVPGRGEEVHPRGGSSLFAGGGKAEEGPPARGAAPPPPGVETCIAAHV